MLWQVRAMLEDRPGALAGIAARCGDELVNILGLQIFPAPDGRVVDELVLHTPGGWSASDVHELCRRAGVESPTVMPCSPQALEDPAVRHIRAAAVVLEDPDLLLEQLCRLLGASPAEDQDRSSVLVLDDGKGQALRLWRILPFTDTEFARASELQRLAALVGAQDQDPALTGSGSGGPAVSAVGGGPATGRAPMPKVTLRRGRAGDAAAVVAMHARCSAQTVARRYHSPIARMSPRFARALLEPADGLSLVLEAGEEIVGLALLAFGPEGPEAGIMIEDGWQHRGLGTRLLRALVDEAAERGVATLTCLVQPDTDAVLRTIQRAELRTHVSRVDGLAVYRIPVGSNPEPGRKARRGRPAMSEITTPLVALLHRRRELREVHPAADLIDQAVRGGA